MQLIEVQKALYSALSGVISAPVYEDVPQGTGFPCVTIGEGNMVNDPFDLENGVIVTHTIHVWSRNTRSNSEVLQIQDEIYAALHRSTLPLVTLKDSGTTFTNRFIIRDPDGITRHGVIEFESSVQTPTQEG